MKTVDGLMENRDFSLIVGFTLLRESSNVIRETEKLRDKFLILPENMTKNVDNLPSKYMDEYIKKLEKEKELTKLLSLQNQVKCAAIDMITRSYKENGGISSHPASILLESFDKTNIEIFNFFSDILNALIKEETEENSEENK